MMVPSFLGEKEGGKEGGREGGKEGVNRNLHVCTRG
jgi:hypothetical protein